MDESSDVYSFGVTLFNAMTGVSPFERPSEPAAIAAVLAPERPSLRDYLPDASPELDDYLQQLMARLPEDRPATAREVLEQLDNLLSAHGVRKTCSKPLVPTSLTPAAPPPPAPVLPSPATSARQLRILDGPLAGTELDLARGMTIGRMTLNPSDKLISRFHCRVVRKKDGFLLHSFSSLNGLIYRNRRVRRVFLKPGDEVVIGNTALACK